MTRRARAQLTGLLAQALLGAGAARAGVWITEPVVGLQTDFSTNPSLASQHVNSSLDGAALLDLPTTYTANGWTVALQPTVRYSDTSGYTSLVSTYEHFTASAELDTERNSVKVTGLAQRDSSLFQEYNENGSTGTRQDTGLTDVNWTRAFTERTSFNMDVNASRVRFDQSNGSSSLTDYTYSVASPSVTWQAGERTKLTALGSFSFYDAISGVSRSTDANFELGFVRQWNELWTVSLNAGISRESDKVNEYFGPFLLDTLRSTTRGSVFSGNITRQGERLTMILQAARSLAPNGFAFLSRSDQYTLQTSYALTERWTAQAYARYRSQQIPVLNARPIDLNYADGGVSAAWMFTEKWTVSFIASHVSETYSGNDFHAAETQFSIQLLRKLDPLEWH